MYQIWTANTDLNMYEMYFLYLPADFLSMCVFTVCEHLVQSPWQRIHK